MIDDCYGINLNKVSIDQNLLDEKLPPGKNISYNLFQKKKYYE